MAWQIHTIGYTLLYFITACRIFWLKQQKKSPVLFEYWIIKSLLQIRVIPFSINWQNLLCVYVISILKPMNLRVRVLTDVFQQHIVAVWMLCTYRLVCSHAIQMNKEKKMFDWFRKLINEMCWVAVLWSLKIPPGIFAYCFSPSIIPIGLILQLYRMPLVFECSPTYKYQYCMIYMRTQTYKNTVY